MALFSHKPQPSQAPKPPQRNPHQPVDPDVIEKDLKILRKFTEVYCRHHHGMPKGTLCELCQDLLDYAYNRRERCPYDPKPKCKECPTHCYKPRYRQQMKEIMRFSGMYFVKRGRLDWMIKYFLGKG